MTTRRLSTAGRLACVVALGAACGACTWVKLTDQGRPVHIARFSQVSGCDQLGEVTAHVLDKVAFVKRSRDKQARELATLARNEAGGMGGNTIVPSSGIKNGRRRFTVYRCK